ncbi:MAG: D-tyrosyl-tRNA(Tyr) deacylase [Gammaproteobacteria bacterium]|jgi:D-aminoacyl-tRNA deacylase|nr:D-tyrosyl-tRNA(Tyr) deacylase [Gammaproteobacteria bacterium]
MIGLLQRVSHAEVRVKGETIGKIGGGLLVLVGVEPDDNEHSVEKLLHKILGYRIFEDREGRMNLSLQQVAGGLLLVPQFTLAADTRKGMRPGFSTAAPPEQGRRLFHQLVARARALYSTVAEGEFGADMEVSLVNQGPATFLLQTATNPDFSAPHYAHSPQSPPHFSAAEKSD